MLSLSNTKFDISQIFKNPNNSNNDNYLDVICLGKLEDPDDCDLEDMELYFEEKEYNIDINNLKLFMYYNAEEYSIYWCLDIINDIVVCWSHQDDLLYICKPNELESKFNEFEFPY